MFPKQKRWRNNKYRNAARGQNCTLRFPGCRNDTETVVLAHRPGAGMGVKSDDHDACDADMHCHDVLDGRTKTELSREWIMEQFERARLETIINRLERGILK